MASFKTYLSRKARSGWGKYVPQKVRWFFLSFVYGGKTFYCPCCERKAGRFLPYGLARRYNVKCPYCGSLERHRLLRLYLNEKTNFLSAPLKVLHFAPEENFQKLCRSLPNLDYVSADLYSPRAMVKVDITDIPFADNTFDVILCYHVLEHILDDGKAMRELFRVLKPTGWAILQVPIQSGREKTYEDSTIVSPEEREKHFGQHDHVRHYGLDYKDRLEQAGFNVKIDNFVESLGEDLTKKYSLIPHEHIYFCTKAE